MIIDANTLPVGHILEADLCVVGSGPAGVSLAHSFRGRNERVLLLEGGGTELEQGSQELYRGVAVGDGENEQNDYLTYSRLRQVGGTSNHWSGWCRPLGEMDILSRANIRDARWPVEFSQLIPYYKKAARLLKIADHFVSSERALRGKPLFPDDHRGLCTHYFHISPLTHHHEEFSFRRLARKDSKSGSNIQTVVHANVLEILAEPNRNSPSGLKVCNASGQSFYVRAKRYVLCCGGIENVRLLFNSSQFSDQGLGNGGGALGRYFMEHPHVHRAMRILYQGDPIYLGPYRKFQDKLLKTRTLGVLAPSEESLKRESILNFCLELKLDEKHSEFTKELTRGVAGAANLTGAVGEKFSVPVLMRTEQLPNPDSRVSMIADTDRFGYRKVRLDWRLSERDRELFYSTLRFIGREVGTKLWGRAQLLIEKPSLWVNAFGGAHHMGTTRMSSNERDGVVDSNLKVHGVDNLFVLGSSVFPSVGYANPTFTIVALALRLGEHLQGVV